MTNHGATTSAHVRPAFIPLLNRSVLEPMREIGRYRRIRRQWPQATVFDCEPA